MQAWRRVWSRMPLRASTRTMATSAVDAPVAMLRVYCSWPGVSAMMNLRLRRGEVAVGNVDRDSLLALGAQAVGELGEVDGSVVRDRTDLVVVDVARVVEQAADQRGLAVVDAAGGAEAQQALREFGFEALPRSGADGSAVTGTSGVRHYIISGRRASEVALPLLDLHGTVLVVVDDAVGALGVSHAHQFLDDLGNGVGVGADGAGARAASERTQGGNVTHCSSPGRPCTNGCSMGMRPSPRTSMSRGFAK